MSPSSAAVQVLASAKCEEDGGIDLLVIYNSGRYRMAGRGSLAGLLAYGDANEIVIDMAKKCCPSSSTHPCSRASTAPIRSLGPRSSSPNSPAGLCRGAELSDGRAHRRRVSPEPGRDRDELRARGRDDRRSVVARPVDHPLRFSEADAVAMTEAGCRHHRVPHGPDHRWVDRSGDRADARRLRRRIDAWADAARPCDPT